ncbi:hypothetical protein NPIL_580471 [Nephila pilipes]|uniref:Uncharacterized protein n=1 Tax=Nephila pilipes TaxID=299642 RepID=A0A8X6T3B8_NEPPI|nr:hypothetical protein NPIL_74471 [Nephila pilipes]GFT21552.1 hypothetical protein NPIL_580471 [Nephila pilipes]
MTEVNPVCEFFVSDCWNTGPLQEEEPMDWEDVPTLPEVIPPFYPIRPPRKMRNLVSKVSEPPVSANRFPNMRALVPKITLRRKGGVSLHPRGCPVGSPRGTKVADLQVVFLGQRCASN